MSNGFEKDIDNISNAILDLLQLVTYEAVRAHTFRLEIYNDKFVKERLEKERDKWLDVYAKEKEYATVLEYMSRVFREIRTSDKNVAVGKCAVCGKTVKECECRACCGQMPEDCVCGKDE